MFTENAVPHAGLHVFNHTGQEITQDIFIEDYSLGHSATGFFFQDLNNDGYVDLLMSDKYTESENEIVMYLNNGLQFIQKTVELDYGGFYYPIDINNDGFFELLQLNQQYGPLGDNYQVEIHYLDYSNALGITDIETGIKIYPNPSFDYINISADSNFEAILYDFLGKELIRKNVTDKLDISSLENGTYILNLTDGINSSSHKIIKN